MHIVFNADGRNTHVELKDGETTVSELWIVPFTLRVGAATVRMDGIASVGTPEAFRNRGYSRRVIEAALAHMAEGDAALTMLYGIPSFYPKFGFVTAGPDYYLLLRDFANVPPLPEGWTVREAVPGDYSALSRLYEEATRDVVGAAVREPERRSVQRLRSLVHGTAAEADRCLTLHDPAARLRGYLWLAPWHWYVRKVQNVRPNGFIIGEALADSPESADALLTACRHLACDESRRREAPLQEMIIGVDPGCHLANAARYQSVWRTDCYDACGGSMARLLNARRLLESLLPELSRRLRESVGPSEGSLRLDTDLGDVTLRWRDNEIELAAPGSHAGCAVSLPQGALVRLALGAFPPADLLARLETPVSGPGRDAILRLFPLRHPHMHLPDRF